MRIRSSLRLAIGAVALFAAAVSLAPDASAQGMDPDQERARQLIVRIRRSMREIDSLLLTGAQPDKIEKELSANVKRIEDLLKETESKSQAVIQGIDDLIKLTKFKKQKNSDPNSSPSESDPNDPQKQPEREKSQDPSELQKQPKPQDSQPQDGQEPKPDPKDGKDPKDQQQKGDPKGGKPDRSKPEQTNGQPPKSPTGEFERKDTSGRWGMLPPKEAEDLQRRDAEEFPQRYRRWMELYFQRVNRLPARDR